MSFSVSQKTLERLDWPQVLTRLEEFTRTPRGRRRFARDDDGGLPPLFETSARAVRQRLDETAEARAVIDAGDRPPLSGVVEIGPALERAQKGGVLSARELLDLASTLGALRGTRRFFSPRRELAPRLAEPVETLVDLGSLEDEIRDAIEPSGAVRDAASSTLARARRDSHRLGAEIQERASRYLRDPNTTSHLSDNYYTVRNDRYVLPVRADARGSVRGIVHDASSSGTTLFVEPEALVELNNRLKQAELEIERETLRVLRSLSSRAAAAAAEVEHGLAVLEELDVAFARAELSRQLDSVAPEVGDEGIVRLPQLRHPGLPPDQVVPNDVSLGVGPHVLVVSGPNAGGKTVTMKAVALAVLFVRAGLHVPAAQGARIDLFDSVLADIGDEQDIRANLSTFSAHMANLARIVDLATPSSLVVLDEIGVGTDPGEGAALAQAVLEALADRGARAIVTTHYNLLKEMADVDDRFANASVEFDDQTLAPTYRLTLGVPGASSARAVAARMGLASAVLDRAGELLEREDRQLDALLVELQASRAALEREQRDVARVRAETESVRDEHRERLEKLQARRDKLYRTMREDLDRVFRDAHDRVAGVIRDLQRGGTAQDAARAREELIELAERAAEQEASADVTPEAPSSFVPVDWPNAVAGDPVRLADGGEGVLVALPDRRGRVAVRRGSARILVPAERVGAATDATPVKTVPKRPAVSVSMARDDRAAEDAPDMEAGRCDLRGMRVDEALDRLVYALDRAASAGRGSLLVVHGLGTGALMKAVRQHLRESPYVARFAPGAPDEGGDGATRAELGG